MKNLSECPKTLLVSLAVALASSFASAQTYKYCGMRMYYATANNGAEMPNTAMNIGGTVAQYGTAAGDQAQDDANHDQHEANRAERWGNQPQADADQQQANSDQNAATVDAGIAVGGALVGAIGAAKQKSHLMEVYKNIREAVLQKHQPGNTDSKDLQHTLGIINKEKDPTTGKRYNYTLAQLSQAVLDSVRSNSLCNDGNGNLVATDNFRNTLINFLNNPLPPPAPAAIPVTAPASAPADSQSAPTSN